MMTTTSVDKRENNFYFGGAMMKIDDDTLNMSFSLHVSSVVTDKIKCVSEFTSLSEVLVFEFSNIVFYLQECTCTSISCEFGVEPSERTS